MKEDRKRHTTGTGVADRGGDEDRTAARKVGEREKRGGGWWRERRKRLTVSACGGSR